MLVVVGGFGGGVVGLVGFVSFGGGVGVGLEFWVSGVFGWFSRCCFGVFGVVFWNVGVGICYFCCLFVGGIDYVE